MTTMAVRKTPSLLDRLPQVRGRYREHAPLDGITWFRVGGPAEVMFRPADQDDLLHFLKNPPIGCACHRDWRWLQSSCS